ncbi:cell division protein [Geobacillus thermocatenulatus]|uniref:Cell division protein n=1 Tax=Geobacillus thermocatenulatus TaxID=33938 RepID=A0A226QA66_9BACL|nr:MULTISPECIES: polysaccharide biosynthesis protein [Geobacillus]ASS98490.1 cell division protein [Geobacillus thermocatenulatus]KLR74105.1 cell division protein [Geobacillus sp. T6]OXB89245.1 cell division protein [Geobacillus thermocatenulatus]RAN22430.1 cell division protein [Geobacillus sp. A8]
MSTSKLLRGTFILTAGVMISRLLGLFYVIPFYHLVGERGGALYGYGYVPYQIFLSLATGGLPVAVSKFVSKYNALGEYGVGYRLFRSGLVLMIASGIASWLILYALAPILAPHVIDAKTNVNSVDDVTAVIRAVSFALLIVPVMSLIRGFFQGHESMGPTALSQVVEQIARIAFLLGACYVILRLMDGSIVSAVSAATFAAFVGAAAGLLVLLVYWWKRRPYLQSLLARDRGEADVSLLAMYKELLLSSIPFVFVGLSMSLYQLVDQFTFNHAMAAAGRGNISEHAYSVFNMWAQKLVIIPVTLATSFSLALIPTITKAYVAQDRKALRQYLNQTFQVLMFLTLPAVIGMAVLAGPVYSSFYSYDPLGEQVLRWYAPAAILYALFSVTAAIMQGINEQRFTVVSLTAGLLVKLLLNTPLIMKWSAVGAIVATMAGYFVSVAFNLWVIQRRTRYRYRFVARRTAFMAILTAAMSAAVMGVEALAARWIDYRDSTAQSVSAVAIGAAVGAAVYLFLSIRSGLFSVLFGDRFAFWRRKEKKAVS